MENKNNAIELRQDALRIAQEKAIRLFQEVDSRELIKSGISEKQLNQQIYQLAFELYGIKKYWHKRIVRTGKNTLCPYKENPADLVIQEDDILFIDLGPVFEDWEADFGRTYVIGDNPLKIKLKNDVEEAWGNGKNYFQQHPDVTGRELYTYVCSLANKSGWTFGQVYCGHLIGNFPHELIQGEEVINYIHPDNNEKMRDLDAQGRPRDWILEIHFIDPKREIGGFFEQLLTV